MTSSVTRRDLLTRQTPAIALAGLFGATATLLAQQAESERLSPAAQKVHNAIRQAFVGGRYALPQLPYAYDALEPHIDAQTMQLHHARHHQSYVDGLNRAHDRIRKLAGQGDDVDMSQLAGIQRDLSFNGGGHVLHVIFWATMGPDAGGEPQGPLAETIAEQFGSFEAFKGYFSKVAASVKGSGWAILGYEPMGNRLSVFASNEHDAYYIPGTFPLLPLDVWEHAYYLRYQNQRTKYIQAWWNVVDWQAVSAIYELHRPRPS